MCAVSYRTSDPAIRRLAAASTFWWALALTCWINDRFACDFWGSFSFPYPQLHSWWHVLILIASYTGCVLCALFYALHETPQVHPKLVYWPWPGWEFGVPYVELISE